MSKTILITGGGGYIGSVVARRLIEKKYTVINVDRSGIKVKDATNFSYDIENISLMKGLMKLSKPDAIIHLGANASVPKSILDPIATYHNNVSNTINFAKSAIESGVKYFIFSSSSSVYGNLPPPVEEGDANFSSACSPYGRSKFIIERVLYDFANAYEFYPVCLRYFNVAGTYQELGYKRNPKEHVIPLLCERAVKNEKFTIYGNDYNTADGTAERDYSHVLDIANGHLDSLEFLFENNKGTVVNLGNNNPVSIKELVALAREESGNEFPVAYSDKRIGDPSSTGANINRAKSTLGWRPRFGIKRIIREEINWAKKQNKKK